MPETPVVYVDENGRLDPAAVRILEYMSEKDMALGTGHGSAREVDALVRKAVEVGMKKILGSTTPTSTSAPPTSRCASGPPWAPISS